MDAAFSVLSRPRHSDADAAAGNYVAMAAVNAHAIVPLWGFSLVGGIVCSLGITPWGARALFRGS